MSIGKKIIELLRMRDISETDLAKHLGISPARLSSYLNNKQEPDINMLDKVAKYLSVNLDYFTDQVMDMQQSCLGITLGCIEDIHSTLDRHQKLVDYLIYEIADLSEETVDNRHIYAYMLELSNAHIEEICIELDNYILKERKRILSVET